MHYYSDEPISIARGLLRCFFSRAFPGPPKALKEVLGRDAAKKLAKVLLFSDIRKYFCKKMYFFYSTCQF